MKSCIRLAALYEEVIDSDENDSVIIICTPKIALYDVQEVSGEKI